MIFRITTDELWEAIQLAMLADDRPDTDDCPDCGERIDDYGYCACADLFELIDMWEEPTDE